MRPQHGEVIQDPAAGTGGFLVAADHHIKERTDDLFKLTEEQAHFQRHQAYIGAELVPDTHRLCLMNLMLHSIEGSVGCADTLSPDGEGLGKADLVLTNPPFGTKKGGGRPTRSDFSITADVSNKQLAFVEHVVRALKPGGRAAVVVPDNVLFEDTTGLFNDTTRADLGDPGNQRQPRGELTMSTAAYRDLENLPARAIGELFDGQLHAQSRPAAPHVHTQSFVVGQLFNPFYRGVGGPGGWVILSEPEIHFKLDIDVAVPDLAGWRRERKLKFPMGHKIELVPDWVCEILSPSTRSIDREIKLPLYARYGVSYAWLVEPIEHVVEAYRLQDGEWVAVGRYTGTTQAAIPPFDAVPLDLGSLWMPT